MLDAKTLLAQHHGGPEFADLMVTTTPGRFNADFWNFWQQFMSPVLGLHPHLLDLGTGPGLIIREWYQRYPSGVFTGVDLMPYMIEKAQQALADIPRVQLLQADLHQPQLPIELGSIDVAQAVVVLHEMQQPIRLLHHARSLLKPGGRLLIVDWVRAPIRLYFNETTVEALFNPETSIDFLEDRLTHFFEHNRYSADDVVWLLERTGFKVIGLQHYNQDRFVRIAAERV